MNRNPAYSTAKAALPRDRLAELYHDERMSLRDIAATVGVSRQIIAQLAHDYDLDLREPGRHARTTVDRDWLYDQYVNKRRALPDIAKEAGMSTANMARWAKTHAIPMRERGGSSHSATLAAEHRTAPNRSGPLEESWMSEPSGTELREIPVDDPVYASAARVVEPPVDPQLKLLPTNLMNLEDFERRLMDLSRDELGLNTQVEPCM